MANLKDIIYLSNEDYETLVSTGTVVIDGETLTYDENNVYVTPDKLASSTEDGLMSSSDKTKLDGVAIGATANTGTVTSVRVQAGTGLSSSQSTAQTSTLNTTISIASGYKLPTNTQWNTCIKDVSLNGTTLTFTKNDNSTVVIDLPSPSGGQTFSGDPNIY